MNELELSNTQSIVFTLLLLGLLLYLNRRDRKKSAQIERESTQTIETTSEDLSPDYGKSHEKVPQKRLDLISKVELKEELGIGDKTLIKWEGAGLPQYIPPIEDTRKAYYKISDVLKFLGVDDGKD